MHAFGRAPFIDAEAVARWRATGTINGGSTLGGGVRYSGADEP
ncbi:hypothetical protein NMD1_00106 [Novosphingobium sp. MD-1]|nr:hypothetical protein NMD1_00106 [Novosphingobium sp. MD-1]